MYRASYSDKFVEATLHAINVFFHPIDSPCFGKPHVPSSGSLCSCYHNASYGNVGRMHLVHVKLVQQPNFCDFFSRSMLVF